MKTSVVAVPVVVGALMGLWFAVPRTSRFAVRGTASDATPAAQASIQGDAALLVPCNAGPPIGVVTPSAVLVAPGPELFTYEMPPTPDGSGELSVQKGWFASYGYTFTNSAGVTVTLHEVPPHVACSIESR